MQFTLPQPQLVKMLGAVRPFVSARGPLPVLQNFLIGVKDGSLSIYGNDLDVSMLTGTLVIGGQDGRVTAPAKQLADIVAKLPNADVEFSSENGVEITIKCKRSKFTLRGLPAQEYPEIEKKDGEPSFELAASDLANMIARSAYAARTDDNTYLGGVLVAITDGQVEIAALDGVRVGAWLVPVESKASVRAIIPKRTMQEVLKVAKSAPGKVAVYLTPQRVMFDFVEASTIVTGRAIAAEYPGFRQLIDMPIAIRACVDRESLLAAVDRVSIMALEQDAQLVEVKCADAEITVTASRAEMGGAQETVPCGQQGDSFTFTANARYLLDAIRAVESDDLTIGWCGEKKPIRFCHSDPDHPLVTVMMPFS